MNMDDTDDSRHPIVTAVWFTIGVILLDAFLKIRFGFSVNALSLCTILAMNVLVTYAPSSWHGTRQLLRKASYVAFFALLANVTFRAVLNSDWEVFQLPSLPHHESKEPDFIDME
jgi:hypothetical protein